MLLNMVSPPFPDEKTHTLTHPHTYPLVHTYIYMSTTDTYTKTFKKSQRIYIKMIISKMWDFQ